MPDPIYKLQPHRTIHLQGFSDFGAAAAIHHASDTGFTASGVFRDAADFCVIRLWDRDDFFGYPRFSYLPDPDFTGIVLAFDLAYENLQPIDSPKFATIDWPYLNCRTTADALIQIPLFANATQVAGDYLPASGTFTLVDAGLQPFDRVTLWYQNLAFDYIVPNPATGVTAASIVANLRDQINAINWAALGVLIPLEATASGADLTISAARPGYDGDMIRLYALHKNANLYFTPDVVQLQDGSSEATWRVEIDFSAHGAEQLDRIWLTLAPRLADSAVYEAQEWQAVFSNWSVSDPEGHRALKVAGPRSVRIEENDRWVEYSGFWEWAPEGFYSGGRAKRAAATGASVTIETHCGATHDIYIGARLDFDCGIVEVAVDGGAPVAVDCYAAAGDARQVRRLVASGVAAGQHSVTIMLTGTKNAASAGFYHYFDFVECAVPDDVPDPVETYTDVGVACDYDTDHTYKLAPQRLVWAIQKLGLLGEIDHYVSVFWWNQRKRVGGFFPSVTVTFGGTWAGGDEVFLTLGATTIGKSVFPADSPATIAAHFAYFINETFVGVWAEGDGTDLIITVRSPTPAYLVTFDADFTSSAGTVNVSGSLIDDAEVGEWVIDDTVTPVLNRAARDWHADHFAELEAAGLEIVCAFSQELVLPPDDPPAAVWVQRYPDGEPVATATGFGDKLSNHCAFAPPFRDYIKQAYEEIAELMESSGLEARLQLGEVLWWFFPNASGMAFYDAYTTAQFQAAEGRALHTFLTPNEDPSVNAYVDADFLRQAVQDHVDAIRNYVLAAHPNAKFELLWPLDVNHPDTRQLNRYINLPPAWETKLGSGLDWFRIEGFQFGRLDRNLDQIARMVRYPFEELAWPRAAVKYLMGHFDSGWPWQRDYLHARRARVPRINLWAYDHLCLFDSELPLATEGRLARLVSR
jgi:hypothetical protein